MDFRSFSENRIIRHAAPRALEIVSEAVRHPPDDFIDNHPQMDWPVIRAAGNVLRQEYFRLSDDLIWATITNDLPALLNVVEKAFNDNV